MHKSPGHQQYPDHRVEEQHDNHRLRVEVEGARIADSTDLIVVDEDHHPKRYYFPRSDVKMAMLEPSTTKSECPFKGEASYFNLRVAGQLMRDVVWTYEDPYEEHRELAGRLAFYEEKLPKSAIRPAAPAA